MRADAVSDLVIGPQPVDDQLGQRVCHARIGLRELVDNRY